MNQSDKQQTSAHFVVKGRVQGVGFRAFVAARARESGLVGWVRNRSDGRSVELVAIGDPAGVERLEEMLHRGPPGSVVESVQRYSADPVEVEEWTETSFEIRR